MRDISSIPYVLREHRSGDNPPTWYRRTVRARDVREARAAATVKGEDGKERVDGERFACELLARVLKRLDGEEIVCDGARLEVPSGDLVAMQAWVERLPLRWVQELGLVVTHDCEPTPEDERGSFNS